MLQKVFDLFTQADRALDRQSGGLGIGLALVRRLVDLHGGQRERAQRGVGTRHRDGRAAAESAVEHRPCAGHRPQSREESAAPPFRACRILIVDDNKDAADSMALSVQLAGHTVCTAYDGQEGLQLAFGFAPDVLLLDLGMPGLNGFEMAQRIRRAAVGAGR